MLLALAWQDGSDPPAPLWVKVLVSVVVGAVILLVALIFWTYRDAEKAFAAWAGSLGFLPRTALPPKLVAPRSAWVNAPKTRRIFAGQRAGFACVLYQVGFAAGESVDWKSAIAVERGPVHPEAAMKIADSGAMLDQTSTAGWVICLVDESSASQKVMEPLLRLLTERVSDWNQHGGERIALSDWQPSADPYAAE